MLIVYGIRQCDTCRKALKWLDAAGVDHRFHDLRIDGLEREMVQGWLQSGFANKLVNRRSTTWRQLTKSRRQAEGEALVELLLEYPTLIKRPVFVDGEVLALGFGADTQRLLGD